MLNTSGVGMILEAILDQLIVCLSIAAIEVPYTTTEYVVSMCNGRPGMRV